MLKRVRAVNLTEIAGRIVEENAEKLAELNKRQLMKGLNNKGELLSPKHSENPWFKTKEAALRYAGWKHRKFPETPFDVPNLIITGVYHNSIFVSRAGDNVNIKASATFAGNIEQTFKGTALGLNDNTMEEVRSDIIRPPLAREVAKELGVTVG